MVKVNFVRRGTMDSVLASHPIAPGLIVVLLKFSNVAEISSPYPCFAPQMAPLGFYNDSSLFTSPVTNTHARAHDDRYCEVETACGGGTREDRSSKIFGHVRVQTGLPAWQVSALSISLYTLG